ncbi:hypothetical protein [Spirillospora sp. CA-294931]|uniref:hypothetical protein n=1 Tax=Spirillospora sp. CA-294931 TaxID=3240042 RepID=UPI003D918A98
MTDIIGQALLDALARAGFEARLSDPSTLSIALPDGTRANADITEWRRHAGRNSRADLPGIAAEYAGRMARGFTRNEEQSEIAGLLTAESLRLRLYTEDALTPDMRAALVTRPLAPGLVETVVVDYPDSIMPLNRTSLGTVPEAQVFDAAIKASLEKEPHYTQRDDIQGVPIMHIGETHRYIGAHIHVLPRYLGPAPHGALVSFPIPEYVVVHELGPTHVFTALDVMQHLARTHVAQGQRALTSQLYWWRPNHPLHPVGIEMDHTTKSVHSQTPATNDLIDHWTNTQTT